MSCVLSVRLSVCLRCLSVFFPVPWATLPDLNKYACMYKCINDANKQALLACRHWKKRVNKYCQRIRMLFSVAPEAVWQLWRPPYQSDEIWAVDSQENH